ncbi:uncharacterized protein LOC135384993 [Ornithodoros turicata]|uniref:uncharacterized protein LOC135384993 n=1 Tax=Ornithodoros turicata TaxID=34597 RepID=UPI003139368F
MAHTLVGHYLREEESFLNRLRLNLGQSDENDVVVLILAAFIVALGFQGCPDNDRFLRKLENFQLRGLDCPSAEVTAECIEVDLDFLVARKAALHDLDLQILVLTEDDKYDDEVHGILDCEQQLEAAITRAKRMLRTTSAVTVPAPGAPTVAQGDAARSCPTSRAVSLPKLQIPKFGGKLQDWARFWEHFQATVHDNHSLAAVEKFKYLLCYVTDDAKRTIDGISLSGANYNVAVEALKQRFGRTDLLAAEHIDKLLALRAIHSSDVIQLRHLLDEAFRHTRALEALEIPLSSYEVVLYRVVSRCLPSELFVQFRQRRKELVASSDVSATAPPTDATTASPSAATEVKALMDCAFTSKRERRLCFTDHGLPIKTTRMMRGPSSQAPEQPTCALCRTADHRIAACSASLTPEEKRRRLASEHRCFRCARRNHRCCRSAGSLKCGKCQGNHLTVVCDIQPLASGRSAAAEPVSVPAVQATAASTSSTITFLQTATATISGPGGSAEVRVLLGSQRTFVTENLARQLRCPIQSSEGLFAFGSTQASTFRTYDWVSLCVAGLCQSLEVDALAIPHICRSLSPPVDARITEVLKHRGLRPATTSCASQNVDLLVGADHYWRFVSGKIERLPNDMTAIETIFGWVVHPARRRTTMP